MQQPPPASPVRPTIDGGRHVLAWDDVRVEIDAATGGRVTALCLGGRNLLTEPAADAGNYGSTFWPSPQTAWGWPPLAEIDHGPYRAEVEPAAVTMRSALNPALGVVVEKRFAADAARGAVTFDFAIHNRGEMPVQLAAWQITRVPPGGLSLFPTGAFNGENVTRFQPAKMAAMEGLFKSQTGAPLAIIGMPDTERQELMDPIYVPGVLSYLAYGKDGCIEVMTPVVGES